MSFFQSINGATKSFDSILSQLNGKKKKSILVQMF